jgi:hypothetical protein
MKNVLNTNRTKKNVPIFLIVNPISLSRIADKAEIVTVNTDEALASSFPTPIPKNRIKPKILP